VVFELNQKYPEVFDMDKSFHVSSHEGDELKSAGSSTKKD